MLAQEIMIPVYFAKSTLEVEKIVNDITQSAITDDKTKSAAESIVNSIAANGYQIVLSAKLPSAKTDIKVASIQGYLSGITHEGKTPTIVIAAHYDSFGVAPVSFPIFFNLIFFKLIFFLNLIFIFNLIFFLIRNYHLVLILMVQELQCY